MNEIVVAAAMAIRPIRCDGDTKMTGRVSGVVFGRLVSLALPMIMTAAISIGVVIGTGAAVAEPAVKVREAKKGNCDSACRSAVSCN